MATEAETTAATGARASQVRVQLKSRSSDIQLPQETGPILVSTGEFDLLAFHR
jgi:ribosome biogenesis protein YTM1